MEWVDAELLGSGAGIQVQATMGERRLINHQ